MPSSRSRAARRSARSFSRAARRSAASAWWQPPRPGARQPRPDSARRLGLAAGGVALLGDLAISEERLSIRSDDRQVVRPFARLESDTQPRADVAAHLGDRFQAIALSQPARESAIVRVVDVILLHSEAVVEGELVRQIGRPIARREDLEDHLRCDPALYPLLV